jgi:superfamily I DNA/RNA helicase
MKKKLKALMSEAADQVKVSTFHSFAHEIISTKGVITLL